MLRRLAQHRVSLPLTANAPFSTKSGFEAPGQPKSKNGLQKQRVYDPIRSLFYNYQTLKDINLTDVAIATKQNVYEGLMHPSGPKGALTEDKIKQINFIADQKLKNMLESGLTREDLLGINPKSGRTKPRPLAKDPFFNTILKDHQVRLNLIKDSEEYSVEKIIALALRQDIGPDRSMVATGHRIVHKRTGHNAERRNLPDNFSKPATAKDHYLSDKLPNPLDYKQVDVLERMKPILKRPQRFQKNKILPRHLVHWRNTEYLVNYLSRFGKIKLGRLNHLDKLDQYNIAKVVKHSRHMGLLPHQGYIKPHHMIPLRTLEEDIANDAKFVLDFEHGTILREEDDEQFRFKTHHFSVSHGFLQKTTIGEKDPEVKKIEDAILYAFHQKNESLKQMGVNTDQGLVEAGATGIDVKAQKPEKLSDEQIENGKLATEDLKSKYEEVVADNFLQCLIAEKCRSPGDLNYLLKNKIPETRSNDAENETYEDLLSQIGKVKKGINPNLVDLDSNVLLNGRIGKLTSKLQKSFDE